MAATPIYSISTLKGWFSQFATPTQAQFHGWLDSFFHKNESIPAASIDGLQVLLDAKADAANVLAKVGVVGVDIPVSLNGSEALFFEIPLPQIGDVYKFSALILYGGLPSIDPVLLKFTIGGSGGTIFQAAQFAHFYFAAELVFDGTEFIVSAQGYQDNVFHGNTTISFIYTMGDSFEFDIVAPDPGYVVKYATIVKQY